MAILSSLRALRPLSPCEQQLSRALVGDLKSSPYLERNYKELVSLLALHSAVVVRSAFCRAIFQSSIASTEVAKGKLEGNKAKTTCYKTFNHLGYRKGTAIFVC